MASPGHVEIKAGNLHWDSAGNNETEKVVRMTALAITGDVEEKLQRPH